MIDGVLRRLVTELGVDFDDAGAKKAERGMGDLIRALGLLGAAASAASAAIFGMVYDAQQAGDSAAKMGTDIGISVEALTGLEFAAEQSGASIDGLRGGLKTLSERLGEAARGAGPAAEILGQLGIDPRDGASVEDRLLDIADAMSTMDEASRLDIANKLFGASGQEMTRLLRQGRAEIAALREEAEGRGLIISDEQARSAEDFGDALNVAKRSIQGVTREIGFGLMPVLQPYLERISDVIQANREWISQRVEDAIDLIAAAVERATQPFWLAAGAAGALAVSVAALGAPLVATAAAIALAVLAVDDLMVAMEGGESATRDLFRAVGAEDGLNDAVEALSGLGADASEAMRDLIRWLGLATTAAAESDASMSALGETLRGVARLIEIVASGLRDLLAVIRAPGDALASLMRIDPLGAGDAAAQRRIAEERASLTPEQIAELDAEMQGVRLARAMGRDGIDRTPTSPIDIEINVSQLPGEDGADFAQRVSDILGESLIDTYEQAAGGTR